MDIGSSAHYRLVTPGVNACSASLTGANPCCGTGFRTEARVGGVVGGLTIGTLVVHDGKADGRGLRQICGCSSVVEHLLAKERVESSNLFIRFYACQSSFGWEWSFCGFFDRLMSEVHVCRQKLDFKMRFFQFFNLSPVIMILFR